jgi:hypothetical protein
MYIYRFERDGLGPYIGGTAGAVMHVAYKKKMTRSQKKASQVFSEQLKSGGYKLAEFSKAHADKKYIFGCKSKQQLRAYFSGSFKGLFKEGYRVKRYKVPDNEVLDMTLEVAFPVKYHKLQNVRTVKKKINTL